MFLGALLRGCPVERSPDLLADEVSDAIAGRGAHQVDADVIVTRGYWCGMGGLPMLEGASGVGGRHGRDHLDPVLLCVHWKVPVVGRAGWSSAEGGRLGGEFGLASASA
jgi:hypothetical protein